MPRDLVRTVVYLPYRNHDIEQRGGGRRTANVRGLGIGLNKVWRGKRGGGSSYRERVHLVLGPTIGQLSCGPRSCTSRMFAKNIPDEWNALDFSNCTSTLISRMLCRYQKWEKK